MVYILGQTPAISWVRLSLSNYNPIMFIWFSKSNEESIAKYENLMLFTKSAWFIIAKAWTPVVVKLLKYK